MRLSHWESLRPICPRCRHSDDRVTHLSLARIDQPTDDEKGVLHGSIHCTHVECRQEYPIVDGVPVLVPNVREYVASYHEQLRQRRDLNPALESLIGDCLGPGTGFDYQRQLLSTYVWDGYGHDGEVRAQQVPDASARSVLATCLAELKATPAPPLLDLGCGAGRTTFDLAEHGLTLGIDLNFSLVQFCQRLLDTGTSDYPLRATGVVYHRQTARFQSPHRESVDFWVCDATALPFEDGFAGTAIVLNTLDSVASPAALLSEISRVLAKQGRGAIATPFDWSAMVTPMEQWVGGHSQRGPDDGEAAATLRQLASSLAPHLRTLAEREGLPWRTRVHTRSQVAYELYLWCFEKLSATRS